MKNCLFSLPITSFFNILEKMLFSYNKHLYGTIISLILNFNEAI